MPCCVLEVLDWAGQEVGDHERAARAEVELVDRRHD